MRTVVGVISDTHGLLRDEVFDAFHRVDVILHAGDIGTPEVLKELRSVAPVLAVRGNNDRGAWARRIPEHRSTMIGEVRVYVLHDLKTMNIDPAGRFQVVVSGHSHRPSIEKRDRILFLNPGSAGPRRFRLPVTVAHLIVDGTNVAGKLITLDAG